MAELATVFRQPFREQVAAFRLRLGDLVPTAAWDDLIKEQHDRAFMVAGATKADLLADLARAMDKAIAEGTGIDAFRRDFKAAVETHGWHGWTGEGTAAGEAWRTRVIYRTNMRTSYMAGRYAQLQEANFSYWVYRHGGSIEPRLDHLSWDEIALPPDHPFWAAHFPPNGWGCSCDVSGTRSEAGIRRLGGDPEKALPDNWRDIDPRTGEQVGIGKSWGYAPGASVADTVQALSGKLDRLPERPSIDLIQEWLKSTAFERWLANPSGNFPVARISADDAATIGSEKMVAEISTETAEKQLREHPELTYRDYAAIQRTIDAADHRIRDTPRTMIFLRDADDGHLLVVKATRSGRGLFVTSFRRISARSGERQRLIRQFLKRGGAGGGASQPDGSGNPA